MSDKKILKTNHSTVKEFKYEKGNMHLNMTVRVDIRQDLKDCIEMAERFIVEAKEVLAKI